MKELKNLLPYLSQAIEDLEEQSWWTEKDKKNDLAPLDFLEALKIQLQKEIYK